MNLSPNLDFSGSFEVILSPNLDFSGSFEVIVSPNFDFAGSSGVILSSAVDFSTSLCTTLSPDIDFSVSFGDNLLEVLFSVDLVTPHRLPVSLDSNLALIKFLLLVISSSSSSFVFSVFASTAFVFSSVLFGNVDPHMSFHFILVSVFSGSLNILLPDICSSSVCFCLSSFLDVLLVVPSFSSALGVLSLEPWDFDSNFDFAPKDFVLSISDFDFTLSSLSFKSLFISLSFKLSFWSLLSASLSFFDFSSDVSAPFPLPPHSFDLSPSSLDCFSSGFLQSVLSPCWSFVFLLLSNLLFKLSVEDVFTFSSTFLSNVLLVPVLPVNFLEILSARVDVFSFCFDAVLSLSGSDLSVEVLLVLFWSSFNNLSFEILSALSSVSFFSSVFFKFFSFSTFSWPADSFSPSSECSSKEWKQFRQNFLRQACGSNLEQTAQITSSLPSSSELIMWSCR